MPTATSAKQQQQWTGEPGQTPRAALRVRSECKFADEQPAGGKGTKDGVTVPFTMTARTAEPIDHWYWGRVVHDMSGFSTTKPTVAVDYCHNQGEVLGYADRFDTSSGDLVVSGQLTPFDPEDADDRASEVVYKQKLGVPYEASIDFSAGNPVVEYVPTGASVDVNGKTFDGPGVVIRQWSLRGVAVCLYGADPNTSTEFSAGAAGDDTVAVTTVNKKGSEMSKPNEPAAAAAAGVDPNKPGSATPPAAATKQTEQPAPQTPPQPAAGAAPAGELKPQQKYIAAFGDVGARWFLESKPFEDCVTEFVQQLRKDHTDALAAKELQFNQDKTALQGQLDAANQKLAALPRGDAGVTFSNADGGNVDPKTAKLTQNLAPGVGRFAAGIKLPGTPATTK